MLDVIVVSCLCESALDKHVFDVKEDCVWIETAWRTVNTGERLRVACVKCASCSIDSAGVFEVCLSASPSQLVSTTVSSLCPELFYQVSGHIYCCFLLGKFHAASLKRRESRREGESEDERCDGESVGEKVWEGQEECNEMRLDHAMVWRGPYPSLYVI